MYGLGNHVFPQHFGAGAPSRRYPAPLSTPKPHSEEVEPLANKIVASWNEFEVFPESDSDSRFSPEM